MLASYGILAWWKNKGLCWKLFRDAQFENLEINNTMSALTSLDRAIRREQIANQFFKSLLIPMNSLHQLLPAKRDSIVLAKLRHAI